MGVSKRTGAVAGILAKAPTERGDLFAAACPSRGVLEHVTSRWGVLILVALLESKYRFGELGRKVSGVSEKMLAQTLLGLEQDGFVLREVHAVIPPRVEYSLTPLGRKVARRVEALADWIEENMPQISKARTSYVDRHK